MIKKQLYKLKPTINKLRTQWQFSQDKSPILIYQMGKVGSSTVYQSLKAQVPQRTIYHFHSIHPEVTNGHKANNKKFIQAGEFHRILGTSFQELLHKRITDGKEKFDIITLVREPVTRNLSAFFQNGYRWIPDFEKKCLEERLDPDEVIERFFAKKEFHTRGLNWLDREMGGVLGIDVYASPFPKDKGYEVFESDNCRLLLIRMEDLSGMSTVVKDFLGLEDFELKNANVGNQKYYSDLYKKFKKQIKFPEEYIDKLHKDKYSKHFYTPEELAQVKADWIA